MKEEADEGGRRVRQREGSVRQEGERREGYEAPRGSQLTR